MSLFTLKQESDVRGDETASYSVHFRTPPTIGEFVEDILANHQNDWGYIGIYNHDTGSDPSCFSGKPFIEYSRGSLRSDFSKEFKSKRIRAASADGGWSRMDYMLYLE